MKTKWTFGAAILSSVVMLNLAPAASEGGVDMMYTWSMQDDFGFTLSVVGYGNTDDAIITGSLQELQLSGVELQFSYLGDDVGSFDVYDDMYVYTEGSSTERYVGFFTQSYLVQSDPSDPFSIETDLFGFGEVDSTFADLGSNYSASDPFSSFHFWGNGAYQDYSLSTSNGDISWSSFSSTWGFSASVVPAPGAFALLVIAGGMNRRRRRN